MSDVSTDKKLKGKDLITIGIFSAESGKKYRGNLQGIRDREKHLRSVQKTIHLYYYKRREKTLEGKRKCCGVKRENTCNAIN